MPEEKYTRCPGCATVFRVTAEQLAVRAGQVRCGQCKTVFDGVARLVSLAPSSRPGDGAAPVDEAAPDSPLSTAFDAQTLETSAQSAKMAETGEAAATAQTVSAQPATPEDRFASQASTKPKRARTGAYAVAIALLVLLVIGQAAFHFRDAIATFWPATRPAFTRLCAVAGCAVRPLRDAAMAHLSIETSDLQADPAHKGLLILTATVRNRAGWPLAYPHLELTLTDAQDRTVVRRALAPAEYAGGTADLWGGIAANGEIAFKVFIDASATTQAGYRLYMFYP